MFIGKLIERLVLKRLVCHTDINDLHEIHQSAYKSMHSTETALIHVYSHIAEGLDDSRAALLVLSTRLTTYC